MAVIDTARLDTALRAAGLPIDGIGLDGGNVTVFWQVAPTQQQIDTANGIINDPYWRYARRPRRLIDIYGDVNALSGAQKTNIWNDLNAGSPKKYATDVGVNAGPILVLDWAVQGSGINPADKQAAQLRLIVMYVQDNVAYLKNPGFDPTVNVLGDEQIP